MIIKAERMRVEHDSDNDLLHIDFRDEEKDLKGKIEVPSKLISMEDIKDFEVEIIPVESLKEPLDYSNARIVYNAVYFRTKPLGTEKIYSFSAGGLILRLFSTTVLKEFRTTLRKYVIIVR